MATIRRFRECGQEQNLHVAPTGAAPGAHWFNALPGGPCGDTDLAIDYYCFDAVRAGTGGVVCVCVCVGGGLLTRVRAVHADV